MTSHSPTPLIPLQDDDPNGGLTESQLAFLKRKETVLAGGDLDLPGCGECKGTGVRVCPECKGTGLNAEDKRGEDEDVHINSNVPRNIFVGGAPCWLCRGTLEMNCQQCMGTGVAKVSGNWEYE